MGLSPTYTGHGASTIRFYQAAFLAQAEQTTSLQSTIYSPHVNASIIPSFLIHTGIMLDKYHCRQYLQWYEQAAHP